VPVVVVVVVVVVIAIKFLYAMLVVVHFNARHLYY